MTDRRLILFISSMLLEFWLVISSSSMHNVIITTKKINQSLFIKSPPLSKIHIIVCQLEVTLEYPFLVTWHKTIVVVLLANFNSCKYKPSQHALGKGTALGYCEIATIAL